MQVVINNLMVNYEVHGSGEPLVLLHGWGNNLRVFDPLIPELAKKFQVVAVDLPGFGGSSMLKRTLSLDDYVQVLLGFLRKLELKKVILLGHSFGGRIAMKFTAEHPDLVEKLILVGSPFIRLIDFLKLGTVIMTKIGKIVFSLPILRKFYTQARKGLYNFIGEHDYEKAGILKETFKKVISGDMRELASKITKPTLVIWGDKDNVVPLTEGIALSKTITGAKFYVIKDTAHHPFIDKPTEFLEVINRFL